MKRHGYRRNRTAVVVHLSAWRVASLFLAILAASAHLLSAQTETPTDLPQRIQQLTDAMAQAQAQIQETQRQLDEMRKQLTDLQQQVESGRTSAQPFAATAGAPVPPSSSSSQVATAPSAVDIQEIHERQDIQQAEIATHEQTKVESESKYPVKVTGLLLLNGFINTSGVDMPSTPTLSVGGPGSTGATVRQSILGLDARGPNLFGARSYADLRVDFDGNQQTNGTAGTYNGYYTGNSTLLRLRTIHAGLQWQRTEAYFSLDRPIFSPDSPASLVAVAQPALAWSGNLWTWNPQLGVTQDFAFAGSPALRLQAALIDVGNPAVLPPVTSTTGVTPPSNAEQSGWPGIEGRIALLNSKDSEQGDHLGVGGYFAPHNDSIGKKYYAWAGTLDAGVHLLARLQFTGSFYRGAALGGLGGGAYKDFTYRPDPDSNGYYFRPLDDVGGWAQLQEKISERIQFNAAFGLDNVFASELRSYYVPGGSVYQNLARNRTYTGNVIYSPSAYLLFSIEYRHIDSSPVKGPTSGANVIGLGAGYKF